MRLSRENERDFGKKSLSIFVDANTIVSGLVFEGNEALLLKLGAIGACSLITTRYVIDEVYKALAMEEFNLGRDEINTLVSVVYKAVVVHEDLNNLELKKYLPRLDDKKDVHVLAAYEKLKCDILVTGDRELLKKVTGSKTTRQTLRMLLAET
jgi:predicted nucleic acid-binding protein